jgi:hypothetical protein
MLGVSPPGFSILDEVGRDRTECVRRLCFGPNIFGVFTPLDESLRLFGPITRILERNAWNGADTELGPLPVPGENDAP